MPRVHPFLDGDGPIAFAHRGGAGDHPENTERAFRHAVDLGFTHVETDVHVTADGVAVAFHDHVLDRVTDREGVVAELPWSEVQRARVGGTDPIMRLADLLETFPDTRVNLDPKHDAAVEPMADVVRDTGSIDRVCVGSFRDHRIDRARAMLGPRLCIGAGRRRVALLVLRSLGIPVGPPDFDAAQVPLSFGPVPVPTRRFVRAAHAAGVVVHVWTIDDADTMKDLLERGVDGIMTDRLEVIRAVFDRHGYWTEHHG